jgi:hypothetical protein
MKKFLRISLLLFFIIYSFLFDSCKKEKPETPYDLFPLKVGNEFYFKYYKGEMLAETIGTEIWKVVSETSLGGSVNYLIERKLSATYKYPFHEMVITDSISYLQVIEDKSSLISSFFLSFAKLSFKRHQNISQYVLEQTYTNTTTPTWKYIFVADNGLTSYYYHHPPNHITNITLHLDRLKIIP